MSKICVYVSTHVISLLSKDLVTASLSNINLLRGANLLSLDILTDVHEIQNVYNIDGAHEYDS
jgi:hypothetical protein